MGEWLKPAVLKTVEPERVPGVRIPLPPPALQTSERLRNRNPARGFRRRAAVFPRHFQPDAYIVGFWRIGHISVPQLPLIEGHSFGDSVVRDFHRAAIGRHHRGRFPVPANF